MRLQPKDRKGLVDAAMGRVPCDIVIRNAKVVNVFTGEVYPGSVGVYGGFIAHIECDPDGTGREDTPLVGKKEYDAKGAYLTPGFIDSHIHIESTMMTPRYFAKAVIPHGTTTVITDPHEIGNVMGVKGVAYMHECSEDLPMRQLILCPSCVPSLPGKENSGAVFGVEEVDELMKLPRVIGLAEVMDYYGVMNNDPRMTSLVGYCLDHEKFVQGHACGIYSRQLSAYACGGPMSDHECITSQDARDRIRVGINVDARESSISQDVDAIIEGAKGFRYPDNLTFSTDDTESDDIIKRGHENYIAQKAINAGLAPIDAIRVATINAAREADIKGLGAVAPGYAADLLLFKDINKLEPAAVFYGGELVAENGALTVDIADNKYDIEQINSVSIPVPDAEKLQIRSSAPDGPVSCNIIKFDHSKGFMTDFDVAELNVKDGLLDISGDPDLKFAAVINRYGCGTIGQAVVKDYGIKRGAVASTVAHDCHNIVVIYDTLENAIAAITELKRIAGGYVSVVDGKVTAEMRLPVAGLMSNTPIDEIAAQSKRFKEALAEMGMEGVAFPLFKMAILPLPVIPVARLTDLGIINVVTQAFTPIFRD